MMAEDQDTQKYHHHTDANKIKAYIGLLYYSGMWKQSSVHYERLWDRSNGTTTYRCTMPKARFMFLSSSLRFDDKTTRSATDKFGPIRAVWDIFIRNCQRYYKLHNNCTVDEQLLGFRDRCSFRMYIKSKPDKYGLNIVSLNDACTSYMYNAIPYLGKTSTPPNESVSEYFLREVTAPIHGTNRNVTCDNWFTSVPITRQLLEPYRLCITGTIRKNKREIPQAMKIAEREPPASKYCYDDNLTLVSYTPKKNKVVLLLTSYLHGNNKETDGKPDIVHFYNKNKGGTDCFDMLCHSFTVSRRTNRWPMQIFFGILDQAAVNARILLKCKNSVREDTSKVTAESCLNQIYLHLVKAHLQERYTIPTIRKDIKCGIANILHLQDRPAFGGDAQNWIGKKDVKFAREELIKRRAPCVPLAFNRCATSIAHIYALNVPIWDQIKKCNFFIYLKYVICNVNIFFSYFLNHFS
ncbi:uncharacterized protein [Temnothorax longispinosus]|uniref:uncharacterized protein n=1 Tax=Temnothorax longispinosus TaxID=300112 RepID=UPI003A996BBA